MPDAFPTLQDELGDAAQNRNFPGGIPAPADTI